MTRSLTLASLLAIYCALTLGLAACDTQPSSDIAPPAWHQSEHGSGGGGGGY
jgi:hypothetical protein